MFEESPICKNENEFDFKEFIKTNTDSANRTRWLTLALIVGTVVIFIGFYNSFSFSWANYRLLQLKSFENLPENNLTPKGEPKPLLDSYFGINDFNDFSQPSSYEGKGFKDFACEFNPNTFDRNLNDSVKNYIFHSFNLQTKKLLQNECSENIKPTLLFKSFVKGDLDRILSNRLFYKVFLENPERKEETKQLLEIASQPPDYTYKLEERFLVRLNRLLLEEKFKDKILPSSNIIPNQQQIVSKEIPARIAFDDNVLFVDIPIFHIPIDVNDLGFIGGIAIFIVLMLLRFSLSREIKNLKLSFKEAFFQDKLCVFYNSLAMKQVMTVPEMQGEVRNKSLYFFSKALYLLPFLVLTIGVGYDFISVFFLNLYHWEDAYKQLILQVFALLSVFFLSLRCLERQFQIDKIWKDFYFIRNLNKDKFETKYSKEGQEGNHHLIYEEYFTKNNLTAKKTYWLKSLMRDFKEMIYDWQFISTLSTKWCNLVEFISEWKFISK